jgi:hypothetical protein
MKLFKIISTLIVIGLVVGFLYLKSIGIINGNKYEINVKDPLAKTDFKIYQGYFTIDRDNDSELFKNNRKTLFFNGRKLKKITTDHGENDFLVTYKDSLYYQFRYFKTNCRMIDRLDFSFYQQNDSLFIDMQISGTNRLKFLKSFNEISKSAVLRTNIPIDSTGTIYNGLELIKK